MQTSKHPAVPLAMTAVMAAVMAGGMIPPLGIGLACLLFPHRFTREERRTAPQNLLMGASFVTEGALPFALRDPLRVVPACMAGSTSRSSFPSANRSSRGIHSP